MQPPISVARPLLRQPDRRQSGVQHLPLSAAKPWFKSLIVCQPIDGHHGATVRCSTAVSGRRTNFPQPVRMAKADPMETRQVNHPCPQATNYPTQD